MSLLARVCTPLAAAALGVAALPAPAAQAAHGCTGGFVTSVVANPNDPNPVKQLVPPIIDTTGTVDYLVYDVTVVSAGVTCVLTCVVDAALTIVSNPLDPTPYLQPLPPAVNTTPTYNYAWYDVVATGQAIICTGYHDPA